MDNKLSNKIKFLACVSLLLIPLFVILIVYNGKLSGNDFGGISRLANGYVLIKLCLMRIFFHGMEWKIIFHGVLRNGYLMLYFT